MYGTLPYRYGTVPYRAGSGPSGLIIKPFSPNYRLVATASSYRQVKSEKIKKFRSQNLEIAWLPQRVTVHLLSQDPRTNRFWSRKTPSGSRVSILRAPLIAFGSNVAAVVVALFINHIG